MYEIKIAYGNSIKCGTVIKTTGNNSITIEPGVAVDENLLAELHSAAEQYNKTCDLEYPPHATPEQIRQIDDIQERDFAAMRIAAERVAKSAQRTT